jgi:hypothetical protein
MINGDVLLLSAVKIHYNIFETGTSNISFPFEVDMPT